LQALKKGYKLVAQLLGPEKERQPWPKECQGEERRELFYVIRYGHVKCLDELLKRGEDIEAIEERIRTPALVLAATDGQADVVKYLMDNNLNVEHKDRALELAATGGHTDVVKVLLESGAHIEYQDRSKMTALSLASKHGNDKTVQLLLERGALIEHDDDSGETPLVLACREGHESVVKVLLENGADRQHALMAASQSGHISIVQLLLEKDPNVDRYRILQEASYWVSFH